MEGAPDAMSDLDNFDLDTPLGEMEKPKRKPGRPKSARTLAREAREARSEEAAQIEQARRETDDGSLQTASAYGNVEAFLKPLTASQLGQVFGMDRKTVQIRMRNCPAVAKTSRGAFLYELRTAAQYLVEPKVDVEAYIKKLRPNDLPPYLHDAYWAALEKRQKVEQRAGELWETEKVIEVYGELAKRIKSSVTLWTDQLEQIERLTPEQRKFLTDKCDGLLSMVFDVFTSLRDESETGNLQERYRAETTGGKQEKSDE